MRTSRAHRAEARCSASSAASSRSLHGSPRRRPPRPDGPRRDEGGEMPGMSMFLMLAGLLGTALLVLGAFAGPSAGKQVTRRLEELRERHSRSTDVAAQAQLKRIF